MRVRYLAVCAAAVLWAVGGTYASFLIDHGASPVELTEARAWIAAAGVGLLVLLRGRARPPPVPGARAPLSLVVAFGLSIAGANFFYYQSLSLLPVAVAIVVQYTAPGLVVAWAAATERRRPSPRVLGAVGLAVGGVVLLSDLVVVLRGGRASVSPLGLGASIAAAVAFATYMVTGEQLGRKLGPERSLYRGFVVASVVWAVVQAARGRPHTITDPELLPGVLFLAVFTTIVPFLLFLWGMERVGASRAGIVSTLEPLSAALLAFAFLGQELGAMQVAGAAMIVVGIAVVQSDQPRAPAVPAVD